MLSIRFFRTGKKNQPFFKIVVTDRRNAPRGGRFLETVGFYNPITKEKQIKKERIEYWISVGAQPSDTVHNLLIKEGVLTGDKIAVHKKSKKEAPAEVAEVAKPKEVKPAEKPDAAQEPKIQDEAKPEEKQSEPSPQEAPTV